MSTTPDRDESRDELERLRGRLTAGQLDQLRRRLSGVGAPVPPIRRVAVQARLPLSAAQQRMWFLEQLEPGTPTYTIALAFDVPARLHQGALQEAVRAVMRLWPVLRSTFREVDGVPWCFPQQDDEPDFAVVTATGSKDIDATLSLEATAPFDLARGPLLRVRLIHSDDSPDDSSDALLVCVHHLVADAGSIGPMFEALAVAYDMAHRGSDIHAEPAASTALYADYVQWQAERLGGDQLAGHRRWWRETLAGAPTVLPLPDGAARPPTRTSVGTETAHELGLEITGRCSDLARAERATPFMVLLAATAAVLARVTGQHDLLIGVPMSGRVHPQLDSAVGLFVNTVPTRITVDPRRSFRELVRQTRDAVIAALEHQEVPLEWMVEDAVPLRSTAHSPLFQVLADLMQPLEPRLGGTTLRQRSIATGTTKFDLCWAFRIDARTTEVRLSTATDVIPSASARRLLDSWVRLVQNAVTDPDTTVQRLGVAAPEDARKLQAVSHGPDPGVPPGILETVRHLAAADPHRVAICFGAEDLTRGQLVASVDACADRLRSAGVGPGSVVGISTRPSFHTVIGVLSVLAAGAAFLPLDPEQPLERLRGHMTEAGGILVLVPPDGAEALRPLGMPLLTPSLAPFDRPDDLRHPVVTDPGDRPAYVMYTSGSTGRPKGVVVPLRAIEHRVGWMLRLHRIGPSDRVLLKTPLTFDVALGELFEGLVSGALLVVAAPGSHRDPDALAQLVLEQEVTIAHFVPSVLGPFLDAVTRARSTPTGAPCVDRLRRLFCSGEALGPGLAHQAAGTFPTAQVHNLYGPTEAAVEVAGWRVKPDDEETVPIGRPMPGCSLYVLDALLQPVPPGVAGELYIGGVQLALGYLAAPGPTARVFMPDPFAPTAGIRMYRTGDRVVRREDGALVFLGRIDRQLKLRGERVEPGEIEAVLRAHPAVRSAAVRLEQEGDSAGRLVAYVVRDTSAPTGDLRAHLASRLPRVMVPHRIVLCTDIRLTASGKLDYAALAPPPAVALDASGHQGEPTAGVTAEGTEEGTEDHVSGREQGVATLLCEVLDVPRLGRTEDFFDAGGHSLLAAQAVARLRAELGVQLSLRSFLHDPTVAGIMSTVRDGSPAAAGPSRAPAALVRRTSTPLLVTGASGMIGSFVVRELRRRGHRLRLFVRDTSMMEDLSIDDELAIGDLADAGSLDAAARGARGVVHLACTFRDWNHDAYAVAQLVASWAGGPFVLMSSTDVYPWSAPGPIDEDAVLQPEASAADYVRGKLRAERLLREAAGSGAPDRVTILRSPFVWGPHPYCRWQLRTGAGHAFYRAAAGEAVTIPQGDPSEVALSWIDARDLAVLVADCVEEPAGRALNAATGRIGWSDFYTQMSQLTGRDVTVRTGDVPPGDLHTRVRWYATERVRARGFRPRHTDWAATLASFLRPPTAASAPEP
ncbi:non-ribosomal peptide synthetase [Monashia sp. NPDC004114]